jgi:hypothetical protein
LQQPGWLAYIAGQPGFLLVHLSSHLLFQKLLMRIPTSFRSLMAAVVLLVAGSVQQAMAQAPGTGGPPAPTDPVDPTEVPLDGGASLLLAGSLAYGLRKLRQRRK